MRICESSPKMRLRHLLFGSICALPVVLLAGCGAPPPYYGARTIVVAPAAESEPSTHYIYSTVNSTSTIHSTSQSDIHIYSNHPLTGSAPPSSGPTQEEEGTLYQQNQDYQHQLQNAQDEQNRENQQVDQPVIPQLGQPTDQPEAQPASDEPPPPQEALPREEPDAQPASDEPAPDIHPEIEAPPEPATPEEEPPEAEPPSDSGPSDSGSTDSN
jgi:hypothetical protein